MIVLNGYLKREIEKLEACLPPLTREPDFYDFWEATLKESRQEPLNAKVDRMDYPSPYVEVFRVSYAGFHRVPVSGWLLIPAFIRADKHPCLIQYHGFGNHKGWPSGLMHWVMMGLCVLAIDCRGQSGESGSEGSAGGFTTNLTSYGLLNREEYYYRGLYMDAVRAMDYACSLPFVDESRIILRGTSQGGALALAVAALDSRPALCLANVPSNCNIPRRVEGRFGAFSGVNDYLRKHPDALEQAYTTLSYFDIMNMAEWIRCPVFASVGLADKTCPAECFAAAYNRISSEKELICYPFNEHDGAREYHLEKELERIRKILPNS